MFDRACEQALSMALVGVVLWTLGSLWNLLKCLVEFADQALNIIVVGVRIALAFDAQQLVAEVEGGHYGDAFEADDIAAILDDLHALVEILSGAQQGLLLLGGAGNLVLFAENGDKGRFAAHGIRFQTRCFLVY